MDLQKSIERLEQRYRKGQNYKKYDMVFLTEDLHSIRVVLEALEKVKALRDKTNKEYSNIRELFDKAYEEGPSVENSYKLKEYSSVMQELGGIIQELDEIIS